MICESIVKMITLMEEQNLYISSSFVHCTFFGHITKHNPMRYILSQFLLCLFCILQQFPLGIVSKLRFWNTSDINAVLLKKFLSQKIRYKFVKIISAEKWLSCKA